MRNRKSEYDSTKTFREYIYEFIIKNPDTTMQDIFKFKKENKTYNPLESKSLHTISKAVSDLKRVGVIVSIRKGRKFLLRAK